MISKLEIIPNEIFLNIFSYLSWDEILISLWSLNNRINSLICSIFSINNKNRFIFNKSTLSYEKFSTIILPLILNCSYLLSPIKSIHFDEINSLFFDLFYENIYNDNSIKPIIYFPNLETVSINQCLLSQSLVQTICLFIQLKLDQLTLSFHEDIYQTFINERESPSIPSDKEKIQRMFQQLLNEIFSNKCQLNSLQLDITKSFYSIHQCLNPDSNLQSRTISNEYQSYCLTLRRLYIRLDYRCFLEHLIQYVPNLEQLSVHFRHSLDKDIAFGSNIETLILSNGNWFNKSLIVNDLEFGYLKWILNNVNHVKKLEINLHSGYIWNRNDIIWRSFIDANFIRQYCLPDRIINLKDFRFYICANCQLSSNDIFRTINSFKIDSFFIDHQWTDVKCFYNENISMEYQVKGSADNLHMSPTLDNIRLRNLNNIQLVNVTKLQFGSCDRRATQVITDNLRV
ncbi:unnamed protein product [Rotaria sordida]|uniref:F-box domain-containing protein n=1 Tax=Rotaria sordida TaxID=392033 RepID=A0A814MQS3_9BILA|nr:unnamed protein product [Rotaria sordida]